MTVHLLADVLERPDDVRGPAAAFVVENLEADELASWCDAAQALRILHRPELHASVAGLVAFLEATTGVASPDNPPAMIPATCVPWPYASESGSPVPSATLKSRCSVATSPSSVSYVVNCGWCPSIPESTTAHVMSLPLASYDLRAASAFTVATERSMSALTGKSGQTRYTPRVPAVAPSWSSGGELADLIHAHPAREVCVSDRPRLLPAYLLPVKRPEALRRPAQPSLMQQIELDDNV